MICISYNFTGGTNLEPLVLQHTLDGRIFARRRKLRLEDDTKGAIADDLALGILQISCLASDSILYLFADYFYTGYQCCSRHIFRPGRIGIAYLPS